MQLQLTTHRDSDSNILLMYPERITFSIDDFIIRTKKMRAQPTTGSRTDLKIFQRYSMTLRPEVLQEIYEQGGQDLVELLFNDLPGSSALETYLKGGRFEVLCENHITIVGQGYELVSRHGNVNLETFERNFISAAQSVPTTVERNIQLHLEDLNKKGRAFEGMQRNYIRNVEALFTDDEALLHLREEIDHTLAADEAELASLEARVKELRSTVHKKKNRALLVRLQQDTSKEINGTPIPAPVLEDLIAKAESNTFFSRPLFG